MLSVALVGCRSHPTPLIVTTQPVAAGLSEPTAVGTVNALCAPPIGWPAEPLKSSDRHKHQVWLSPSGKTAYGVIYLTLPFPVGPDLVLWAFMREMRKSEGEGILLSKKVDPDLPGIRFVAEGGLYKMRANLQVRGRKAWAVYAGTMRNDPVVEDELVLAERAREHTRIGLSQE